MIRKLFILLFFLNALASVAQQKKDIPLTRVLFIYDASNSMNGSWQSGNKNNIARKLLSDALDSLKYQDNLEIALRIYGHQKYYKDGQDCDDTKLEVPFAKSSINSDLMKNKLKSIQPKGTTPIANTLEKSGGDFPDCMDCRNVIILITDGIEECNGDPCAVSRALQEKGIVLKPFVIGIGLDVDFIESFKCIGNYYDAKNEETFKTALNVVISQALNNTTTQVNLLDSKGLPTESNVNMTFYNSQNGKIEYNYIHTINHKGNPDTVLLDPVLTYNMVVHTIPQVTKENIEIVPGTHNIIAVDAPQGSLDLKISGGYSNDYKNLKTIVRKSGELSTLHVQDFEKSENYLVGKYDLEILTLPRLIVKDVVINQSTATKIEIPQPGIATLICNSDGFGSIYQEKDGKLEWVCNLNDRVTKESFLLQPGNYRVVYRPKNAKESVYTIERKFKISPGSSQVVKLY